MAKKPVILIVDDDDDVRSQMKWALVDDYDVFVAEDRKSALQAISAHQPWVCCLDLGLPPSPADVSEGFKSLEMMLELDPDLKIIVITGQSDRDNALQAVNEGAYDFFSKPIEIGSLKVVLNRAVYLRQLQEENRKLQRGADPNSFEGMLGTSEAIQAVFSTVRKVATSDAPVLISGESGTGKELTARAIHNLSRRNGHPFVPINCGAIPENLLESELFGHQKGAFTGAHTDRPGQLEMAQGGTIFLDEIGELPLSLQVKLLRFLQEGSIQRVGGRKPIHIDARIIAATNIDLEKALAEQQFREDLYYRLAVVVIPMPPLRERDGDIILLARYFLERHSEESRKKLRGFSPEASRLIEAYHWPGNVRELENRVRRAVIMEESGRISKESLGLATSGGHLEGHTLKEAREIVEKELIERALARTEGNITRAAEELAVSRPTLYELMDKLGIER